MRTLSRCSRTVLKHRNFIVGRRDTHFEGIVEQARVLDDVHDDANRVDVELHDEAVKSIREEGGQHGLRLEALGLHVVLDVGLGYEVVDGGDAIVVAHEGGHLGGGAADAVGRRHLDPVAHEQVTELGVAAQGGKVQRRVRMLVLAQVDICALSNESLVISVIDSIRKLIFSIII